MFQRPHAIRHAHTRQDSCERVISSSNRFAALVYDHIQTQIQHRGSQIYTGHPLLRCLSSLTHKNTPVCDVLRAGHNTAREWNRATQSYNFLQPTDLSQADWRVAARRCLRTTRRTCIIKTIQSPTRYRNGECDSKPGHNQKCHLVNVTAPFTLPSLLLQFTSEKSRESTGIPRYMAVTGSLKTLRSVKIRKPITQFPLLTAKINTPTKAIWPQ